MMDSLLKAVNVFLTHLETVQQELADLMSDKRTALTEIQGDALARISQEENVLVTRLQQLLRERHKILEFAQEHKLPSQSLWHLVKGVAGTDRDELIERIEAAQQMSARLRHESWVHWIISHRSYNHYTELIDLIAHCGHQPPTYHDGKGYSNAGGAVLDASI